MQKGNRKAKKDWNTIHIGLVKSRENQDYSYRVAEFWAKATPIEGEADQPQIERVCVG